MKERLRRIKNPLTFIILLIAIPATVILGSIMFKEKYYAWISMCVAVMSCLPIFYCFEKKGGFSSEENSSAELVVLSVLIALSVLGRFVFSWLPGFKPVTAITIITGVWLGKEAGFMVGSLSAVISNFYFGQGPWTPFQMFAWGFIGLITGLLANLLRKNKAFICIYGAIAGVFFSALMDVWTTLWAEGGFNLNRYIVTIISSLPITIEYAISNVIFLYFLTKPIGDKLIRLKKKYGLFITK